MKPLRMFVCLYHWSCRQTSVESQPQTVSPLIVLSCRYLRSVPERTQKLGRLGTNRFSSLLPMKPRQTLSASNNVDQRIAWAPREICKSTFYICRCPTRCFGGSAMPVWRVVLYNRITYTQKYIHAYSTRLPKSAPFMIREPGSFYGCFCFPLVVGMTCRYSYGQAQQAW